MPWRPRPAPASGSEVDHAIERADGRGVRWGLADAGPGAREVLVHADKDARDRAWKAAQPLVKAQAKQRRAAEALADLLEQGAFEREQGLEVAKALLAAHEDDLTMIGMIGEALESVRDMNFLNTEPPDHPIFERVATRLSDALDRVDADGEELIRRVQGLATAARLLGRRWDDVADRAYRRLVDLAPDRWQLHYAQGLFYKTRGRFAEGQAANQRPFDLGGSSRENVRWNLGIGARDGQTALSIWKLLGQKIERGGSGCRTAATVRSRCDWPNVRYRRRWGRTGLWHPWRGPPKLGATGVAIIDLAVDSTATRPASVR
jgi:hypothetical protein